MQHEGESMKKYVETNTIKSLDDLSLLEQADPEETTVFLSFEIRSSESTPIIEILRLAGNLAFKHPLITRLGNDNLIFSRKKSRKALVFFISKFKNTIIMCKKTLSSRRLSIKLIFKYSETCFKDFF